MSNRLREVRVLRRISQYVLALQTGIQQSRISLIENELITPKEEEKQKIAKALGVKVEAIFYEVKNNERNRGLRNSGHSS
jgi:DNA-binding XRE family transcriptional regulator